MHFVTGPTELKEVAAHRSVPSANCNFFCSPTYPYYNSPSPITVTVLAFCSETNSIPFSLNYSIEASSLEYSADTSLYAVADAGGVTIYTSATHAQKLRIEGKGIQAVAFSPAGTYLTTFQRPSKGADGTAEKNLKVWNLNDGSEALALTQKAFIRDNWPNIQFTPDDAIAVNMVTNTLHAYSTTDFLAGPKIKFPVKGIAGFALSPGTAPGKDPIVAVYVPEAKGSPGHIALYTMSAGVAQGTATPISRRSFFRANSARFYWASTGSAVLVLTAADVDATNQSYYGEQKLYFFTADGTSDAAVPLPKEGPVHDVQWNPRGDCFVTVAGFMPAKSTVFTSACVPKFDLGSGPYSTARWNTFGRFLVLAGFGNLPGDLAFFDKKADGKLKPMGTSRAENGVTADWSPCGRYLLAATIAPRLRVDNGFQVFKYDGTLLLKEKKDVMYEARWVPEPADTYEDKPQSPRAAGSAGASANASAEAPRPPQPVKAAGYIPPHLRNNPAAAAAAKASFSLARDPNDKGGKIPVGAAVARAPSAGATNLPPGAAPPESKAASKNAKKRAAAARKKAEEAAATNGVAGLKI